MANWNKFVQGYGIGRQMVNDYRAEQDRKEMAKVMDATPETVNGYGAEDGAQLAAAANAKDENGNPYYSVSTDPNGKYTITPVNAPAPADGSPAAPDRFATTAPIVLPTKDRVNFLGQTFDQAPTPQQQDSARMLAMAGVMAKSDPMKSLQLRQQAAQVEQTSLQNQHLARQGVLTEQQIKAGERASVRDQASLEHENGLRDLFQGSNFARGQQAYTAANQKYQTDLEAYQQAVAGGNQDATAPVAPTKPTYGLAESLADNMAIAAHNSSYGKGDPAMLIKLAEMNKNLNEEGYGRALKIAQGGGDIKAIAEAFNASGKLKLDPAAVVSDKVVDRGNGVKTRVLTFKDAAGGVHAIDTLAELDALGKADQLYTRMFEGKKLEQGDKQIGIQGGHLKVAQESAGRQTEEFNIKKPAMQAEANVAAEKEKARKELADASASGDAKRIEGARAAAVAYGVLPAKTTEYTMTVDPTGVKPALLLEKNSGQVTAIDPKDATSRVVNQSGREATGVETPSFKDVDEADAAGASGKIKPGTLIRVNGRLAKWNPK